MLAKMVSFVVVFCTIEINKKGSLLVVTLPNLAKAFKTKGILYNTRNRISHALATQAGDDAGGSAPVVRGPITRHRGIKRCQECAVRVHQK